MFANIINLTMSARRRVSVGDLKERVPISLKLPKLLLDRIDDVWRNSEEYTGRTHFIEKACAHYLSCEKCPECGKLNSMGSPFCGFCGTKLSGFKEALNNVIGEIQIYDKYNESIFSLMREYDDLKDKIEWLLSQLSADKRQHIDDIISENRAIGDNLMQGVSGYHKFYTHISKNGLSKDYPADYFRVVSTPQVVILYYRAKQLVEFAENQHGVSARQLFDCNKDLESGHPTLKSLKGSAEMSVSSLKSLEKMIVFLIQNQNA